VIDGQGVRVSLLCQMQGLRCVRHAQRVGFSIQRIHLSRREPWTAGRLRSGFHRPTFKGLGLRPGTALT